MRCKTSPLAVKNLYAFLSEQNVIWNSSVKPWSHWGCVCVIAVGVDEAVLLPVQNERQWQDTGEMPRLVHSGRTCSSKLLPLVAALCSPVDAAVPCPVTAILKTRKRCLCVVQSWYYAGVNGLCFFSKEVILLLLSIHQVSRLLRGRNKVFLLFCF